MVTTWFHTFETICSVLTDHEIYMQRCIELALQGAGNVAPNPMVGAVLVYGGEIIGEGFHRLYGGPHAEVNAIESVPASKKQLIANSTLYVSLEPCAHFGKTPPCADLIIANKIPRVVIGCRDPFPQVDGKGIEKLQAAGVEVTLGILEKECMALNKRFFVFHRQHRPFILLKWAETADHRIGYAGSNRLMISNAFTQRLVHKWRSEEAAIMVGTRTAALDDPQLTNRLWYGHDPVRIVVDRELRLPPSLRLFDGNVSTIVFNLLKHGDEGNVRYYQIADDARLTDQLMNGLYRMNIQSVMIEGGAKTIQSFIDEDLWDEARVITNRALIIGEGIPSPQLGPAKVMATETMGDDVITWYSPVKKS